MRPSWRFEPPSRRARARRGADAVPHVYSAHADMQLDMGPLRKFLFYYPASSFVLMLGITCGTCARRRCSSSPSVAAAGLVRSPRAFAEEVVRRAAGVVKGWGGGAGAETLDRVPAAVLRRGGDDERGGGRGGAARERRERGGVREQRRERPGGRHHRRAAVQRRTETGRVKREERREERVMLSRNSETLSSSLRGVRFSRAFCTFVFTKVSPVGRTDRVASRGAILRRRSSR